MLNKGVSFDTYEGSQTRAFVPFGESGRAATFTGDSTSLKLLRRRLVRSNFSASTRGPKGVAKLPRPRSLSDLSADQCVVIVDAFTTGACVAADAQSRGYRIVHVLSLGDAGLDLTSLVDPRTGPHKGASFTVHSA